jgi:hypothetical protein
MLLVSLTFVFGCGERNKSSILSGTVSHKQPIENNSTHEKETDIVLVNTSGPGVSLLVSPIWHKELAGALYLVVK